MSDPRLEKIEDFKSDSRPDHPMTKALRDLVKERALTGAVLLSFSEERVGVNSSAPTDAFGDVLHRLADEILIAFNRGDFDHCLTQH